MSEAIHDMTAEEIAQHYEDRYNDVLNSDVVEIDGGIEIRFALDGHANVGSHWTTDMLEVGYALHSVGRKSGNGYVEFRQIVGSFK